MTNDERPRRSRSRFRWAAPVLIAAVSAGGMLANADLAEPPRFDGAGYAMLARSLVEGLGYRDIDHPDRPEHVHFPPGYPALLAATWAVTGRSPASAHLLSVACGVGAVLASWAWFRRMVPPRAALLLGLALAMNWTWQRAGGSIRSEPLYMLLQQLALLSAVVASKPRAGAGSGAVLGGWLGALTLTRLVGGIVGVAAGLELLIRRRWVPLLATIASGAVVVSPWAWRLYTTPKTTHLDYFPSRSIPEVVLGNLGFYGLRIPDALSAPVIEVGTVFVPKAYPVAVALAILAALVLGVGLLRTIRNARLRLAGLLVVCNLGLLLIWPFTEAGRFLIPLVPALLVVAMEGMATMARRVGPPRFRGKSRTVAAAILLVIASPYAIYAAMTGRADAERRLQGAVDPAFAWIASSGGRPGPIMTTYPAEAFWFTGRPGLTSLPLTGEPDIEGKVDRYAVAYLVATESRFANAKDDPISRYVIEHPGRVVLRWSSEDGRIRVFEVRPPGSPVNPPPPGP